MLGGGPTSCDNALSGFSIMVLVTDGRMRSERLRASIISARLGGATGRSLRADRREGADLATFADVGLAVPRCATGVPWTLSATAAAMGLDGLAGGGGCTAGDGVVLGIAPANVPKRDPKRQFDPAT